MKSKHRELNRGPAGKPGKVQSRRQAVAIALNEPGASKYKSEEENRRHLAKTERREARGTTYLQEREGKSLSAPADDAKAALRWGEECDKEHRTSQNRKP